LAIGGPATRYADVVSTLTGRIAAVLGAVLIVASLSSCSSPAPDDHTVPTHKDEPVVTGEPAAYNAHDVAFANGIIPIHQQGIDISALVPSRSTNPEIVAFAASRVSALQSDMAVLKALLVQWNESPNANTNGDQGSAVRTGMVDQATLAQLNSLHGGGFDALWLQSMIGLDQGAVAVANAETAEGKNVDAVDLATQIAGARQADIDRMKQLRRG
jgi:uncharacterized protein (DUF305 family)